MRNGQMAMEKKCCGYNLHIKVILTGREEAHIKTRYNSYNLIFYDDQVMVYNKKNRVVR